MPRGRLDAALDRRGDQAGGDAFARHVADDQPPDLAFEREGMGVGAQMLEVFQHKVRAQIQRNNPAEAATFNQAAQNILKAIECSLQAPSRDE